MTPSMYQSSIPVLNRTLTNLIAILKKGEVHAEDVLPNVYFHVTTAYDILRHNGVEVGKRDFLGSPN